MSDDLIQLRSSEIEALIREAVNEALEAAAVEIERNFVRIGSGNELIRRSYAARVVRSHIK